MCAAWTLWKTIGIVAFPAPFRWDAILSLEYGNRMLMLYLTVGYAPWVAWAMVTLARYLNELSPGKIVAGLILALAFDTALYAVKRPPSPTALWLTTVTFSVYGGVVEEVLYRGLLLNALREHLHPCWRL